jgi:hypothetical protein
MQISEGSDGKVRTELMSLLKMCVVKCKQLQLSKVSNKQHGGIH